MKNFNSYFLKLILLIPLFRSEDAFAADSNKYLYVATAGTISFLISNIILKLGIRSKEYDSSFKNGFASLALSYAYLMTSIASGTTGALVAYLLQKGDDKTLSTEDLFFLTSSSDITDEQFLDQIRSLKEGGLSLAMIIAFIDEALENISLVIGNESGLAETDRAAILEKKKLIESRRALMIKEFNIEDAQIKNFNLKLLESEIGQLPNDGSGEFNGNNCETSSCSGWNEA